MKITLYFINWNDSFYVPFIKEHYGKFCQRIVMYDNYSTDNSVELAMQLGFEVRKFGGAQLNDQDYLNVKNHCWKECRTPELHADYVIVCDADEFVCPILPLEGSAPFVTGHNMVSELLPEKSIMEINTGQYSESYSKQAIFCPNRIEEINYVHGCHKNNIQGDVTTFVFDRCDLLHYRQIGGVNRMIARHAEYRKRLSNFNKQHKMGYHYMHDDVSKINEWNALISNAKKLW